MLRTWSPVGCSVFLQYFFNHSLNFFLYGNINHSNRRKIDVHLHMVMTVLWNSKSKLSFTLSVCRQFRAALEAAVFSLSTPQALSDLKSSIKKICEKQYSVISLLKYFFIIHYKPSVCQYFLQNFWIFLGNVGILFCLGIRYINQFNDLGWKSGRAFVNGKYKAFLI